MEINNKKLEIENIWIKTNFPDKKDNYIIEITYKHPGSSVKCLEYFTHQIENNRIKYMPMSPHGIGYKQTWYPPDVR